MKAQLEAARAAKDQAVKLMEPFGQVCGVGIVYRDGGYVIKINLETEPLPTEVDGVPIIVHVVGKIRKQVG